MKSRKTYPGSIYADRGRLYIELSGRKYPCHVADTKQGRQIANMMLERLFLEKMGLKGIENEQPTFREAFDEFKNELVNRSDKTIKNYEYAFKAIIKSENEILAEGIIRDSVILFLRNNDFSQVSKFTYTTEFQIFLNYCCKRKWLQKIDLKYDYKVRNKDSEVKSWTEEEINLLLSYFVHQNLMTSYLIRFMLLTGARVTDALNLEWSDIKDGLIYFKNKKTKEEEPRPYSDRVESLLTCIPKKNNKVFGWSYNSNSRLNKRLSTACNKLCIEQGKRSFQEFRVTFRMNLLKSGCPPEYAKHLLRHSNLKISEKFYTEFEKNELKKYVNLLG